MAKSNEDPLNRLRTKAWVYVLKQLVSPIILPTSSRRKVSNNALATWLTDHGIYLTETRYDETTDTEIIEKVPYSDLGKMCQRYSRGASTMRDEQVEQVHEFLSRDFNPAYAAASRQIHADGPSKLWMALTIDRVDTSRISIEEFAYHLGNTTSIDAPEAAKPYLEYQDHLFRATLSYSCALHSYIASIQASEWMRAARSVSQLYEQRSMREFKAINYAQHRQGELLILEQAIRNMIQSVFDNSDFLKRFGIHPIKDFLATVAARAEWLFQVKTKSPDVALAGLYTTIDLFKIVTEEFNIEIKFSVDPNAELDATLENIANSDMHIN